MATESPTPVLDTLAAMTLDSIERCDLPADILILTRIAALVAVDAPAMSYVAHAGPAAQVEVTPAQVQDVLVAIAPIVGTARVMSAATHIAEALGIIIAAAEEEVSG